jgi:RNA polymerase sigma-70 factor (ECF subfamily)
MIAKRKLLSRGGRARAQRGKASMSDPLPSPLRLVALPAARAAMPSAPADDAELVERAQAGGRAAQAELFRRHAPRLLPLLTRLLSSTSDAEDALQDSFVIAFRDLPQLRERAAFAGWLRRIAVHQAHRRFRRRRLWAAIGLDRAPGDAHLGDLVDPEAPPDVRAELVLLDGILERVAARDRAAWILRYVEGYDLIDVADACGCSLATVKRRIAAAHARVQKHFELPEIDDE